MMVPFGALDLQASVLKMKRAELSEFGESFACLNCAKFMA